MGPLSRVTPFASSFIVSPSGYVNEIASFACVNVFSFERSRLCFLTSGAGVSAGAADATGEAAELLVLVETGGRVFSAGVSGVWGSLAGSLPHAGRERRARIRTARGGRDTFIGASYSGLSSRGDGAPRGPER